MVSFFFCVRTLSHYVSFEMPQKNKKVSCQASNIIATAVSGEQEKTTARHEWERLTQAAKMTRDYGDACTRKETEDRFCVKLIVCAKG